MIVLGAGNAGATLARELSRSGEWRLAGLLDDDPAKHGREIYAHKVLGPISDLAHWAETLRVEHAIIAIPSASVDTQRRVATLCVRAGVRAMVLPALTPLTQGQAFMSRVRQIDLEDLLGRDPVTIDTEHVAALLKSRVVMVTGAGGSIGSELCRQILRFGPVQLVAFDVSEFSIYRLNEELRDKYPEVSVVPIVGDVKDSLLLDQVMARYCPHIVFHAAAYKHVPLMEEVNTWQAVRNNVLGTHRVARTAIRHDVAHFVLISTDKAVNPTNVMGASKRLAEMACSALQHQGARPQWQWVIIGEEREGQRSDLLAQRKRLLNVHLLGYRPYRVLPQYLRGMRVGVLPTLINEYAHSMFPMKFYEYLAAGLPVVSTPLDFAKEPRAGLEVGGDADAFIAAIENHLARGKLSAEEVRAAVGENTWEARLDKMLAITFHYPLAGDGSAQPHGAEVRT
ncbi:hypothetical protein OKW40_004059 [Paraburkholderia sp. RAU6.4a]